MTALQDLPALGALLTSTLRSDLRKARRVGSVGADPAAELDRDGIVIVPDFHPARECEELSRCLRDFVSDFEQTTTLANGVKLNFRGSEHGQHAYHDREVADTGMLDVFDIDRQLPALEVIKNDPRIAQTIGQSCGTPVAATSMHAYLNRSVSGTRGYHIDSGGLQYKASST